MLLDKTLRSPVVEGAQATFFYEDAMAQEVRFVGDSTAGATIPMERHGDLWTLTRNYPLDARDEYMFVVDGAWTLDPLNPQRGPGAFGPRSACAMPDYRWPRPIQLPCDGKMRRQRLGGRLVDLYVPARIEGAALLVVQDGFDYIWFTGLPGLLDDMIREGEVVPTLAVFVSPQDRDAEYRPNDRYVSWLADRLVPAVARKYPFTPDPAWHGLMGASLGGSIATYGVLRRPDVFRLAGAQSPAYILPEHREGTLGVGDSVSWSDLRFHVDGGTFEKEYYSNTFLLEIERGVAALREKGSAVQYNEVNEGHNWTSWRGRLPNLLSWLFGPAREVRFPA